MYSRKAWGGNVDPFILTKFMKPEDIPEGEDPVISLVVFEWQDKHLIGKPVDDDVSYIDGIRSGESLVKTDTSIMNSVSTFATKAMSMLDIVQKKTLVHSSQPTTPQRNHDHRSSQWRFT
jgi:hypothetical protein